MSFNTESMNSFLIILCIFALLFVDLIGTSSTLKELKSEANGTEFEQLKQNYNTKLKYTIGIITIVLIYYLVNASVFVFAHFVGK